MATLTLQVRHPKTVHEYALEGVPGCEPKPAYQMPWEKALLISTKGYWSHVPVQWGPKRNLRSYKVGVCRRSHGVVQAAGDARFYELSMLLRQVLSASLH